MQIQDDSKPASRVESCWLEGAKERDLTSDLASDSNTDSDSGFGFKVRINDSASRPLLQYRCPEVVAQLTCTPK